MDEISEEVQFLSEYRVDPSFPSVTERYFKTRIIPESNQCILIHSNKLCLITISLAHPVLKEGITIESIDFETVGKRKQNRLNNKVSGKFKKGGQKLKEKSVICIIKTSDGCEHTIFSCVYGTLVEINERLLKEPNLLKDKPWSEGYIAIILPPLPPAGKSVTKAVLD